MIKNLLFAVFIFLSGCEKKCVEYHYEARSVWKNGVQLGVPWVGEYVIEDVEVCDKWET